MPAGILNPTPRPPAPRHSYTPPPLTVYDLVQRTLHGFWPEFFAKARATLGPRTRITSWWRSAHSNLVVGGVDASQHQIGGALDLSDPDMAGLYARANAAGWGFVANEGDHVHVQAYPADRNLVAYVRWVIHQAGI